MSLALEFISAYLARSEITQADFSKAAGIDASLFTKLAQKEVGLNAKNVPKLLRGFRTEEDRLEFLSKYLEEQIPADLSHAITIHSKKQNGGDGMLMEDGEETPLDVQLVQAFAALPSDLYRRRVIRFLNHLKKDASLRDLFTRTVAYLEEQDVK
jgi:transcriptional regulator with XRE-family HTH domain